jgi:hypothetical protein
MKSTAELEGQVHPIALLLKRHGANTGESDSHTSPRISDGFPLYSASGFVQLKPGSQCTKVEYRDGMDKPPNAGTPIDMQV